MNLMPTKAKIRFHQLPTNHQVHHQNIVEILVNKLKNINILGVVLKNVSKKTEFMSIQSSFLWLLKIDSTLFL